MNEAEKNLIEEITLLLSNLPSAEFKWLSILESNFLRDSPKDLKSSSIAITGTFMKQRIFNLTESENQFLFDKQGDIKKNDSLMGRSKVTCFPKEKPKFYLKQYPEFPGYEYASTLFMRMIGITGLPYQELIVIDSKYPVLLTQAVAGEPVFQIWKTPEAFNNLDPFHTGLLIIAAMLLNPEDGKEDNFILSQDGKYLIPIDNDHCFLPSTFQKEGSFWNAWTVNTALQTKTLLFCLDEMNRPVPKEVKKHILDEVNFDVLLISWMKELVKIDDRYHHFVNEKQEEAFLKNGTALRIFFYPQFIQHLYWKVNKIQDLLRSNTEQTPLSLLKAVEPFAARCYQDSFQHGNTLQSRFTAATSQLYKKTNNEGNRMSVLTTQIMMEIINIPRKDLHNETRIGPTDALEALETLIKERTQKRELEQDLLCNLDETSEESVWTTLFGKPLLETALKDFILNPKGGLVLKGSKLITSQNLRNLFAEAPAQGTKIKFLSLPNSPLLDNQALRMLIQVCPNLEYLNIRGCPKLEEIVTVKGEWPLLSRLEAQECLSLRKFISCSPIKVLRIGSNQKIEIFVEKHVLDIFTISTQTNEFDFSLKKDEDFEMKPLEKGASADDFLQNALLQKEAFNQYFTSPKITIGTHSISSPKDLGVFITSLDLRTFPLNHQSLKEIIELNLINLKSLQLPLFKDEESKILEDLIQGDWQQLSHLNLSENQITDEGLVILLQGNWPLLKILSLNYANLTKKGLLNFTLNTKFHDLKQLTPSLFLRSEARFSDKLLRGNWHLLMELDLSASNITQNEIEAILNKSEWPNLKILDLSFNEITDEGFVVLSQGKWPQLAMLNLIQTRVTNKGLLNFYLIQKFPEFLFIDLPSCVDFNLASCLRQKKFSQVERLDLKNSKISLNEIEAIVNKHQFQGLKYLDMSNNEIFDEGISRLTQAKWSSLEELNLENTGMTSKGIEVIVKQSKWKLLKHLNLSGNRICDNGISLLSQEKWPLLEELYIKNTGVTSQGIKILANKMKLVRLKKLDISENIIKDEGLEALTSANWPVFEHLVYYETKVMLRGNVDLLENSQWPNLQRLEHSFTESFFTYNENTGGWFLPRLILGMFPMCYKTESVLVMILDATWASLKEIYLSISHNGFQEKMVILPRQQLGQGEHMKLSLIPSSIQWTKWPSNLRILDISNNSLSDERKLGNLFFSKCLLLEDLNLEKTDITTKGIEILVNKAALPSLKKLCISHNEVDQSGLELLFSGDWPLLENPSLRNIGMTANRIYLLTSGSQWKNLKILDLSNNLICDEGLESLFCRTWPSLENLILSKVGLTLSKIQGVESFLEWQGLKILDISDNNFSDGGLRILSSGKWPSLESLCLRNTQITSKGVWSLVNTADWPNLKNLNVSDNQLKDQGLILLSSGNWPLLESLNLHNTLIEGPGVESMVNLSKWPSLKILDISGNLIYDTGLNILFSAAWPLLESLSLQKTCITEDGIKSMVKMSKWPKLKVLDITENCVGDKGLEMLSSEKWPVLEYLNLRNTKITGIGIESMIGRSKWLKLKTLDISDNNIQDQRLKMLCSKRCPLLKIENFI